MEKHMKGQFYVLSAFILGIYVFFILSMFTSTKTSFIATKIPQITYVQEAIQDALDDKQDINLIIDSLGYLPEPVGVRCTSFLSSEGGCDLDYDEWGCGVNVTIVYRGNMDVEVTKKIYRNDFGINETRTPISIKSNESVNLYKVSQDVSRSSGTLQDSDGNGLVGEWNGTTIMFRTNLVKNKVKTIYVYHTSETGKELFEDVGVLQDVGYDGSTLYSEINGKSNVEYLNLSDLHNINKGLGPRMLFIPSEYPQSYKNSLKKYVALGGIVVSPYGLCTTSGSCEIGNLESISTSTLTAISPMDSLNPLSIGSQYFTDADVSFVAYNLTGLNTSRSAIGAVGYGEGYVVFVGNESMLSSWNQLSDFITLLLNWGVNDAVTINKVICDEQIP